MITKSRTCTTRTAAFFATILLSIQAHAESKKLLVFIMAGQSNMQGHAEVSTLAYLPKPPHVPSEEEWILISGWLEHGVMRDRLPSIRDNLLKEPVNAQLPKKEFEALLKKTLEAELAKVRAEHYEVFKKRQTDVDRVARDKELAAIFTPNLTDQKIIDIAAKVKSLKTAPEIANTWASETGVPIGKKTYIAAYGGVGRDIKPGAATGPLSTGYGARPSAFGPEYAFGIMMEKALDQPILIIKTAWGGKSLHYDFRPPSAGPYQPTTGEKEKLERWKASKATWDKYLAGGGSAEDMVKMNKDYKALQKEVRSFRDSIKKMPAGEQAEANKKLSEMQANERKMRQTMITPPLDMPAYDKSGFYWNEMVGFIHKVLADPKAFHPEYDPKAGYEVAGGIWFQGFNDQFDPEYYGNYSGNMVHYIQDLRKEVKNPAMPFVIGVLGTPAFPDEAMANNVANGQREAAKSEPLAGNVAAVESWPLTTPEVAIWNARRTAAKENGNAAEIEKTEMQWRLYGSNAGYHYDGSGRFFIRLGDEFATSMLGLMKNQ